ncbi:MAG: hypothetical protein WBK55_00005, partial [Alphaproteobacteria bacterium]
MYVPPQQQQPSLLLILSLTGLFAWGAWKSLEFQALPFVPYVLGFVALVGGLKALALLLIRARNIWMRHEVLAKTEQRGSASWATRKDLRRAGLYKTSGV